MTFCRKVFRHYQFVLMDLQWLQASQPVKEGGLGIHCVTSLATFAFLASAAGTKSLQQQLLSCSGVAGTIDPTVSSVRSTRSAA